MLFFIGKGALLARAIEFCLKNEIAVLGASCPSDDPLIKKFKTQDVKIWQTSKPNEDLIHIFSDKRISHVFSINNRYFLDDEILCSGPLFFNIHNGLTQNYRGVAEMCLLAALFEESPTYGATIHKLLPNQAIDNGPIVKQAIFEIEPDFSFEALMARSLVNCEEVFANNLSKILKGDYNPINVKLNSHFWRYKDIKTLVANSDMDKVKRITELGIFRKFFPKLEACILKEILRDHPV